ncbi:transposase, partial [Alloprevotella sp. OH1205_COT-284]
RLSFMRFLGLSLEDSVPDSTTICRFRNALVLGGLNDQLLFEVNRQLEAAGVIIKSGVIVDASVTDSPRRPRGSYTMVDDRNEEVGYKEAEAAHFEECTHSNIDGEARWLKKGGQSHYGYKRHTATDENGLILAEVTTPANQSDILWISSICRKIRLYWQIKVIVRPRMRLI